MLGTIVSPRRPHPDAMHNHNPYCIHGHHSEPEDATPREHVVPPDITREKQQDYTASDLASRVGVRARNRG